MYELVGYLLKGVLFDANICRSASVMRTSSARSFGLRATGHPSRSTRRLVGYNWKLF